MKIFVRTLKNEKYEVPAEGSDTIAAIKSRIHELHSLGTPDTLKLIYSGKVLKDEDTVASAAIKDGGFLVLMIGKPTAAAAKPSPAPAPAATTSSAPSAATLPPTTSAPAAASASASAAAPAAAVPSGPSEPASVYSSAGSAFVRGPELEGTIAKIMEMGFERDQVVRALKASFNNPDRAVDYLFNGIPEGLEAAIGGGPGPAAAAAPRSGSPLAAAAAPTTPPLSSASSAAAAPPSGSSAAAPAAALGGFPGAGLGGLDPAAAAALASGFGGSGGDFDMGGVDGDDGMGDIDPSAAGLPPAGLAQLEALRRMIQANPAMLEAVIATLAQRNPALLSALGNREMLMKMLADPMILSQLVALMGAMGGAGGAGGMPGMPGSRAAPGMPHVIRVTEEEKAALERLEALGFPRHKVIEAYFACDKNEELAANYLFENGFGDEDLGGPGGDDGADSGM